MGKADSRTGRRRGPALRALLERLGRDSGPLRPRWASGFEYAEIPAGLLDRVPEWLERYEVPGAREIRPHRVYRRDDLLVKLYGPGDTFKDRFRRSRAVRSADWYARLLPLRTPRPLLAIELRSWGRVTQALLVAEFVSGHSLTELWNERHALAHDAFDALPRFMAEMHRHRVYHGDLHPQNLIWDGREWTLIDLDGMRRRQHVGRRIVERQWVRLFVSLGGDRRLRPYFEAYLDAAGWRWDADAAWRRIVDGSAEPLARRARREARPTRA
jgi:hypothetical protein